MHWQTEIHGLIHCKCMGKLKYIGKFIASAWAAKLKYMGILKSMGNLSVCHAWSKCLMNAWSVSKLMLMHYQILKCKWQSNANVSSILSNTNSLSNANASSAIVSCMHDGRFDPVLLGISSGCFGVVASHSLSDSKVQSNFSLGHPHPAFLQVLALPLQLLLLTSSLWFSARWRDCLRD